MLFNATFNKLSVIWWRSVLLMEETGVPGENIMLSRVHHSWAGFELTTLVVMGTDCTCSCKSNHHMIPTTTIPQ